MGLMRRMPPKHSETALSALLSLLPHHSSDLLSQVDQPLQVGLALVSRSVARFLGSIYSLIRSLHSYGLSNPVNFILRLGCACSIASFSGCRKRFVEQNILILVSFSICCNALDFFEPVALI